MCGEELTKCVVDDLVQDKCAVVSGQVCQVCVKKVLNHATLIPALVVNQL